MCLTGVIVKNHQTSKWEEEVALVAWEVCFDKDIQAVT